MQEPIYTIEINKPIFNEIINSKEQKNFVKLCRNCYTAANCQENEMQEVIKKGICKYFTNINDTCY